MTAQIVKDKVAIAEVLIGMLEKDDDPRAPEVKAILEKQRDELLRQREEAAAVQDPVEAEAEGTGKPPAQVVGLKALELVSRRG